MEKSKKITFSSILLYVVLALSLVHFTFIMLSLFNVLTPAFLESNNFNYVIGFVLVGVCLALYIILMFVEKSKKLSIPEWFKVVFYIGFYVFTNVYYFLGLYSTLAGLIVFYAYLAFVLNIIALSIFFNTQKSETNILKTTTNYTVMTTFAYAITGGALIETIISAFKILLAKTSVFSTLSMLIIDMCTMILVSVIMAIIFALSLSKTKTIINKCLIKYYN